MTKRSSWYCLLGFAVVALVAVAFTPAQARNNNGVYLNVADNLDRNDPWARSEVRYSCSGGGDWRPIRATTAGAYCKSEANIEVWWYDDRALGPRKPGVERHTVNDDDSGHCGSGEAVVWTVFGKGEPGSSQIGSLIRQEPDCLRCDYTGGPCE